MTTYAVASRATGAECPGSLTIESKERPIEHCSYRSESAPRHRSGCSGDVARVGT